jgi:hypothetical protein
MRKKGDVEVCEACGDVFMIGSAVDQSKQCGACKLIDTLRAENTLLRREVECLEPVAEYYGDNDVWLPIGDGPLQIPPHVAYDFGERARLALEKLRKIRATIDSPSFTVNHPASGEEYVPQLSHLPGLGKAVKFERRDGSITIKDSAKDRP